MLRIDEIHYHLRVISLVIKIRVTIIMKYKADMVYWIIAPFFWIVPFLFAGKALAGGQFSNEFKEVTGSGDYLGFLLIGNMLYSTIDTAIWGIGNTLRREQQSGTLEYFWISPAPRVDLLIGSALSEGLWVFVNVLCQFIIISSFFHWSITPFTSLFSVLAVVLMFFAMLGFGMIFASIVILFKEGDVLTELVDSIMTIVTPLRYPINALPRFLLWVAVVIPFTWGAAIVRGLLLANAPFQSVLAYFLAILAIGVVLWVIGLYMFRKIEQRSRRMGTLGAF